MFENNTYQAVLERMLSRVPDKFDKREGSIIYDAHSPAALEFQFLYIELERLVNESFGDTASREFLIRHCRERGITPYTAAKAILKGEFTPADIDVSGRRFSIGPVNFLVLEKIADGIWQVQCETPGRIGSQYFGNMVPIDYVEGLETARLTEVLIPGEDEEDTESLRKRYFASFEAKSFGGNQTDYLEKVNAIPGVGGVKVKRVWNGDIRPADMIPSPAVEAWYNAVKPTLSGESAGWLEAVYTAAKQKKLTVGGTVLLTILSSDFGNASETLTDLVQQTIDPEETAGEGLGLAPIGHVVKVESAEEKEVHVRTEIAFEPGYGWDNLRGSIETAISDYLMELRREWADSTSLTVRVSQVETRLLNLRGVLDIRNTSINGAESNLPLGEYEIPVFGSAAEGVGG